MLDRKKLRAEEFTNIMTLIDTYCQKVMPRSYLDTLEIWMTKMLSDEELEMHVAVDLTQLNTGTILGKVISIDLDDDDMREYSFSVRF